MILFGKIALGIASTVAFATIYTFREGVIRVDVDESRAGGSHVHVWVPAAVVPIAVHFTPSRHFQHAGEKLEPWLPTIRRLTKELQKYPNADFVDVRDGAQHVQVRTRDGKLQVDVHEPGQDVHVAVPIDTIEDLAGEISGHIPGA
jgi:hypothetical protein